MGRSGGPALGNPMANIYEQRDELAQWLAAMDARVAALDKAGAVHAHIHWRKGGYLYLIHPVRDGRRKKVYIGVDADKQIEALERVARYAVRIRIERERAELAASLAMMDSRIRSIADYATMIKRAGRRYAVL